MTAVAQVTFDPLDRCGALGGCRGLSLTPEVLDQNPILGAHMIRVRRVRSDVLEDTRPMHRPVFLQGAPE